MSEPYTPTTDEVRVLFLLTASKIPDGKRGATFDRWLASEKAKAWDEGFEAAKRWNAAPMIANPYRQAVTLDRQAVDPCRHTGREGEHCPCEDEIEEGA